MPSKRFDLLAFAAATIMAVGIIHSAAASGIGSHIHGLQYDPTDPNRIFAATHEGLYVLDPSGEGKRISDHRNDMMGFVADPKDPKIFLASGHPRGGGNVGVLRSEDGGRSWKKIADGVGGPVDFHAMTVSPSDPSRLYGLYGGIQASRDGGRTWTKQGGPKGIRVHDIAASGKSPDILYAATDRGILMSRDAGKTWAPGDIRTAPASMVHVGHDGHVYAYLLGTGFLRAADGTPAWQVVAPPFTDQRVLLHMDIDPKDPTRMIATDDQSRLLASTDGGTTWLHLRH